MFGTPPSSSAFYSSSTTTLGASSSPAFGASSASSFGSSSSPIGGFRFSRPGPGGFVSAGRADPFESTSRPSQPAFGSVISTPSGTSNPPAFGSTSMPGFGSTTSSPSFGTSSTPAFGGTIDPALGAQSTPAFRASSTPAFGSTTTPAFGNIGSEFGVSSTPTSAFGSGGASGSSSTTGFGASRTPAINFGSSPAGFAQSASATTRTFGTTGFGQPSFVAPRWGSRVTPYRATTEVETAGGQLTKLESVSAMPEYKEKSHEELRWKDYQVGDKGQQTSAGQSLGGALAKQIRCLPNCLNLLRPQVRLPLPILVKLKQVDQARFLEHQTCPSSLH
ncbi:LOW QUALITY PROTEIN: hypothetical protein Tsubulata_020505 [Turnera subulata]|uniref:Uncharacterized protein n=1 Tax=Turnera subulata TaxID=218843 RepID=A0A9Q0J007_9ROSI|nr:LOW QUALITY PROTEIN: hypothetical protein Tsubulata_020505 [Turnera subulata]